MHLTHSQIAGLNTALNEATLNDLSIDVSDRVARVVLQVLSLPEEGRAPGNPRVELHLFPVGHVAASLRYGRWDDRSAVVEPVAVEHLGDVVRSFGGEPIYGEEFFDVPDEEDFDQWSDRLSLNLHLGTDGLSHTLTLFQEGSSPDRHLDIRIWFEELLVLGSARQEIALDVFIAGGERWWERFWEEDPRTEGYGMHPILEE